MNAPLQIRIGIYSKTRNDAERWRETATFTETWVIDTHLDTWSSDFDSVAPSIWSYVRYNRDQVMMVDARFTLRLENVTADTPPKGAWVQAKQNYDGMLADGEYQTSNDLRDKLETAISIMKKGAKY